MNFYSCVKDFQTAFRLNQSTKPLLPNEEERKLRIKLLREEFEEYLEGEENNDLVEIADALADLIYIACGTAVSYGIPLDVVFDEVHRSNMAKLVNGKPIYREDGKVLKPEGWTPPDIERIINIFNMLDVRPTKLDNRVLLGAMGEQLVVNYYRERGHEVVISPNSYDNVKDMTIDGKSFEVKTQTPLFIKKAFTVRPNQLDKCMNAEGLIFIETPSEWNGMVINLYFYPKETRRSFKISNANGDMCGFKISDGILLKSIDDPIMVAEMYKLSSANRESIGKLNVKSGS